MENISKELNYSPVVNNHSSIVYRNISPQSGTDVPTNQTSSVGPTEFLVPPSCWIPELCKLQFGISIPADAADANFLNGNILTSIDRITVYDTATSNIIMDCSNFHKYTSLVTPAATKLTDYLTKPTLAAAVPTTVALANPYPIEDISKGNLLTVNDNAVDTDMAPFNPYLGRRNWYITAATAAGYVNVSIPFSAFKMTALSSDKIWYSPSSLVIQIYWAANDNYVFRADAVGSPVTGSASLATAVTIVKPQLILANEGNLAIVSQVINKVMSGGGIQLPIAYPTVIQTTTGVSSDQSFQYQLTRGYGNRILAILTAPFSASALLEQRNYHPRYVTTYYNTFLNNVAIRSPNGFVGLSTTAPATDYGLANFPYLRGSVIQTIYEYVLGEWVHIDGFFGNKPLHEVDQHQVDGLDVTAQSSTWQVQASVTSAAYRWFSVVVGQKTMSLTAQGVLVQ